MRAIDRAIIRALLRIKARDDVPAVPETDEEVWRTSKEGPNAGRHFKIETETGEIKAGFGGKLNGVKAVPKAQRQSTSGLAKSSAASVPPKQYSDPVKEPKNAEPQQVAEILDQKYKAAMQAMKAAKMVGGDRNKAMQAVQEFNAYAVSAKENPEYWDKIYKSGMRYDLENNGADYQPPKELDHKMTEEEIIDQVVGVAPRYEAKNQQALAYIGCKAGYDVHSRQFSKNSKNDLVLEDSLKLAQLDDPTKKTYTNSNSAQLKADALKGMETGKEYLFVSGSGTKIVRKNSEGKCQYLDLYDAATKGWKDDSTSSSGINAYRYVATFDVDSLTKSAEFKHLLGYVNGPDAKKEVQGKKIG